MLNAGSFDIRAPRTRRAGNERVSDHQFVMRCWECEELGMLFARYGFGNTQYFGAYDHSVELGATDRLVSVAQLSGRRGKP